MVFFKSAKRYKYKLFLISFILILFLIIKYFRIIIHTNQNKFFFFEKNQDELRYCTYYGLMIYEFPDIENPGNIGDYIQSLAALQYLPKNCKPYFVDRDTIQFYKGPKVKLIMNSWNRIYKKKNIYQIK